MTELETILGAQVLRHGLELKVLRAMLGKKESKVNPVWINWANCLHIYVEGTTNFEMTADYAVLMLEEQGFDVNTIEINDAAYWCNSDGFHIALLVDKPIRVAA